MLHHKNCMEYFKPPVAAAFLRCRCFPAPLYECVYAVHIYVWNRAHSAHTFVLWCAMYNLVIVKLQLYQVVSLLIHTLSQVISLHAAGAECIWLIPKGMARNSDSAHSRFFQIYADPISIFSSKADGVPVWWLLSLGDMGFQTKIELQKLDSFSLRVLWKAMLWCGVYHKNLLHCNLIKTGFFLWRPQKLILHNLKVKMQSCCKNLIQSDSSRLSCM